MNTEKELRKWLNRSELSFVDNLNFGVKVWNSIEFVLLTKQEIIVDEFCNNLAKLRDEIARSTDVKYGDAAWEKVNEFLGLRYSSGAVSVAVKDKLIKTLSKEADWSIENGRPSQHILNALLITLQNSSIQNYYKSNATEFARYLGTSIRYLSALLQTDEENGKQHKEQIDQLLESLKEFIKQSPFLDDFKSAFAAEILTPLVELLTLSQNRKVNNKQVLLSILQELYFDGSQTSQLKQYLGGDKVKFSAFHELFEKPMHVFLMVVETIVWSFRNDDEVQQAFFRYLFDENTGKFRRQTDESMQTQLNGLTVFVLLLQKYDVPLNFQVDSTKAVVYLGKQIEHFVNAYHTTHVYQVLNLLCAILKLNPLILEYSVCQIAVKFMLLAKKDESVWNKYEEFMFLVIEMYRRLSRAEKFISQLIKNLYETLSTVKLSKKLKRSFNSSFVEGSTPSKKAKTSTEDEGMDTTVSEDAAPIDNQFVTMFEENILSECESLVTKADWKRKTSQVWNDIAFAFSPAISSTYVRFISGLVSKPSLVVWKTLIFTLKDYVKQLNEADGKCSENCVFLVEITSALLSQYFMGSRLAEQSDKSWDAIDTNRNATREILSEFGHAILNQEHNYRTMNAFLKLCYSSSNFDLLCWYYRPDSMRYDCAGQDSKTQFDVEQAAKKLHSYLTEKEWITIEQRITNFGKRECKANINKIYLQRMKTNQLFEVSSCDEDISKYVLSTAFKDVEQMSDILNDPSLGGWFIGNLNGNQKRTICELLLQSTSEFDTLNRLRTINDWQFIEILTFATYEKVINVLAAGKHSEYLTAIDFEQIFERKFKKPSKTLATLIEENCMEAKCADKKHIQKRREQLADLMGLLENLPIGFGKGDAKGIISLLNTILYRFLAVAGDTELSAIPVRIFKALLHFGEPPNVFGGLQVSTPIAIFKDESDAKSIFALIFERVCRDLNETNAQVLDELCELLAKFDANDDNQQRILLKIGVLVLEHLAKDKRSRTHFDKFRELLFDIIKNVSKANDNHEWLFATTLPAFVIIVKTRIATLKANPTQNEGNDEQTNQLVKRFLKNSIDCTNSYSVKLLNAALENKSHFGLAEEELKDLVAKYWTNFKVACGSSHDEITNKTLNSALKIICDHKTMDEWIELLTEVEKEIDASIFSSNAKQQSRILASMAKCQYNKSKGQIFTGFYKNVTRRINLTIRAKSTDLTHNFNWISNLLECYTILVNNMQTPLSVELIDDILAFLSEINVKSVDAETFDSVQFKTLGDQMCGLCLGLVQHRPAFLMDRVPHFVNVFKDLLQTICWYKSKRSHQAQLGQAEITMLAEMAHSLEKTNKYFVKHSTEVKRVAPYLLLFTISLMITNDRPTTLYAKIKTHIEYICYDLIAVCDHRVEGFILRNCNEASKAIYENLHRDYEKYFKFRGKV